MSTPRVAVAFKSTAEDVLAVPKEHDRLREEFVAAKNKFGDQYDHEAVAVSGFRIEVIGLRHEDNKEIPKGWRISKKLDRYSFAILVPDKRLKVGREAEAARHALPILQYANNLLPGMPKEYWDRRGVPGSSGIPIYSPSSMFVRDGAVYLGWPVDVFASEDDLTGKPFKYDEEKWQKVLLSEFWAKYLDEQ